MTTDGMRAQLEMAQATSKKRRAELTEALAGREGWSVSGSRWSHTEFSGPGDRHTIRELSIRYGGKIHVCKSNGHNIPTDVEEFDNVAEAVAWIETPRDPLSLQHRLNMAELKRYAKRNDVDLDGLKGKKVDSGLNPKRQSFSLIEFEGFEGRVRLTTLGENSWRLAYRRRSATVTSDSRDEAKALLRKALEQLKAETEAS